MNWNASGREEGYSCSQALRRDSGDPNQYRRKWWEEAHTITWSALLLLWGLSLKLVVFMNP